MKKFIIPYLFALLLGFLLTILLIRCSSETESKSDLTFTNMKAISLKNLQKKISEGNGNELKEIRKFYGMTRLYGFYYDDKEKDLILFGEADKSKPHLIFDDFVVSLRQTYMLYSEKRGDTNFYSDPSCTIDPNIDSWNRLDELDTHHESDDNISKDKVWETICGEPQSVKVFGIPANSHLASVMVNADYFLKEVSNGMKKVSTIEGFQSLQDMRKAIVIESYKNGKEPHLGSPVNRFEFTSGDAFFLNSENLYLLYKLPVVVITEEEYKSTTEFKGTGKADSLAKKFTNSFNENYNEIAKVFPVFDTLINAYRIYALAKSISESNLITDISFFDALINKYSVDTFSVPTFLPGKSTVNRVDYKTSDASHTYYLYSCGGVNLTSKLQKTMLKKETNEDLLYYITNSRPGKESVHWNFEVNAPVL